MIFIYYRMIIFVLLCGVLQANYMYLEHKKQIRDFNKWWSTLSDAEREHIIK